MPETDVTTVSTCGRGFVVAAEVSTIKVVYFK